MKDRRLLFQVILKSLFFLGIVTLIAVFLNSLLTNQKDPTSHIKANKKVILTEIDISDIRKGQVKRVRWGAQEIGVLYRQFSKKSTLAAEADDSQFHSSLSPVTRSIKADYFVFINHGDSGNCPLYYAKGEFHDTCSKNIFDENGLPINQYLLNYRINIPPHYFEGTTIKIGAWKEK